MAKKSLINKACKKSRSFGRSVSKYANKNDVPIKPNNPTKKAFEDDIIIFLLIINL